MFSTVLAQMQSNYFLEQLTVLDSVSVAFSKRHSSDVIQANSCELQSRWFPLVFVCIMSSYLRRTNKKSHCFWVSVKLMGDYSSNIEMLNISQFK